MVGIIWKQRQYDLDYREVARGTQLEVHRALFHACVPDSQLKLLSAVCCLLPSACLLLRQAELQSVISMGCTFFSLCVVLRCVLA